MVINTKEIIRMMTKFIYLPHAVQLILLVPGLIDKAVFKNLKV